MNRDEWLASRRTGIGASEIAAIAGLSPWGGPVDVYCAKLGLSPDRHSDAMAWGLRLEGVIAAAYSEREGVALEPGYLVRHPDESWILATPDRFAPDRLVELKVSRTSEGWGEQETDDVPPHYLLQCQWQMLAAGYPRVDIAALIGGVELRVYTVERSETVIESLVTIGRAFWRRVLEQRPPDVDWSHPAAAKLLDMLLRPDPELHAQLSERVTGLVDEYESLGKAASDLKEQRDLVKARIIDAMGNHGRGTLPDGRIVSRKETKRKAYTVAETTFVDFRILASKRKGART